ncbi:MAG: S4 domain-containing protein YaaA [Tissierellales bacterium]|jgi:ribosome-associated protein|nr:S4 domain-containing protein YaaA [Tissierellales bacterium]
MNEIKIKTEFIRLDQLLKFADIAQTGGHAKILISDETVKVNGEICTQRTKKIRPGDVVEVEGEESIKILEQ